MDGRGRPTRISAELIDRLIQLLSTGVTVGDACDQVGISRRTYYNWLQDSKRACDLADALWARGIGMPITTEQALICTFLRKVTRAHADAKVFAIATLRKAMHDSQQTEVTIEEFRETRLRRDATGAQVPYEYVRKITRNTTRDMAGDWRASLEFLKRRYPEEWGDRLTVDWRMEAVKLIQSGEIVFDVLAEEVGEDDATELFVTAGVPIPRT